MTKDCCLISGAVTRFLDTPTAVLKATQVIISTAVSQGPGTNITHINRVYLVLVDDYITRDIQEYIGPNDIWRADINDYIWNSQYVR